MTEINLIKDSSLMSELKESLYVEYNQERIGIHVSDLIYCPRESIFRKLQPIPLTDRELNFFTSGRAIHDAIQTLAKYFPKYEIEKEIELVPVENEFTKGLDIVKRMNGIAKDMKIFAHIDMYDKENNIPIEAKSTRKAKLGTKLSPEEKPKSFNVTQLKIYMSLVGADKGYLMYQLLLNFDSNPFTIFEVTMTEDERKAMLKWLITEAIYYIKALKEENPAKARHVAFDKELNWKCESCHYLNECIGMRNDVALENKQLNINKDDIRIHK